MDNDGAVKWDIGDQIGIFSDLEEEAVAYIRGSDGTFRGTPISGNVFYAYSPSAYFGKNTDSPLTISYVRSALGIGINTGESATYMPIPMVAKSNDNHLAFKQVCGLLHFQFADIHKKLLSISLSGNNNERISGYGTIDLSESNPSFIIPHPTLGSTRIDVTLDREPLNGSFDLYCLVPEIEFARGLSMIISYEDPSEGSVKYLNKNTYDTLSTHRGVMISFVINDFDTKIDKLEQELEEAYIREKNALIALYNSLDGDHWNENTNWCSDKPVEEWYGVTVNNQGRVQELSLPDNHLVGVIPEEIGDLSALRVLNLRCIYTNNELSGEIPSRIGELAELRTLDLQGHRFSGTIPKSIFNLNNLELINLEGGVMEIVSDDNKIHLVKLSELGGTLPEEIGNLKWLRELDLQENHLTGKIPESIVNLMNLYRFWIAGNEFSGNLPPIDHLPKLKYIQMGENCFIGNIPSSYSKVMDNLPYQFSIGANHLSGRIPDEIFNHPLFSEYADQLLSNQVDGYGLEIDETKVPACKHTFETLDGGTLNLGEQYAKADYTMIVRWAEWCPATRAFMPIALRLSDMYKDRGLQTIWSYAGGDKEEREAFMSEFGLNERGPHIIESYLGETFVIGPGSKDHAVWFNWGFGTPFVEIVDKEGHIVFVDDSVCDDFGNEYRYFDYYSFSHRRKELDFFLFQLFN